MDSPLPDSYQINHLKQPRPWTDGMAGLFYWAAWDPKNLFGVSKAELFRRVVEETIRLYETKQLRDPKLIADRVDRKFDADRDLAKAARPFDPPAESLVTSMDEAVRRARVFTEDYLTKEFDVFLSLLPDHIVGTYLASHFPTVLPDNGWSVFGHSREITTELGMEFMQIDTLAYSHNRATLVALEHKIDARFEAGQFRKYCSMAAYLEYIGKVAPGTQLHLLLVEAKPSNVSDVELREQATAKLDQDGFPAGKLLPDACQRLAEMSRERIASTPFARTTWQALGDYFAQIRIGLPAEQETLRKLIDGFLISLRLKRSSKRGAPLFTDLST